MSANDTALAEAIGIVERAHRDPALRPQVASFFDPGTSTISHIVRDASADAAIIDSVLDFDPASGRTRLAAVQPLLDASASLRVQWLLETHVHADHLSAAPLLKQRVGGRIAIGREVTEVQRTFGDLFGEDASFARDGSQFDHLFADGERFMIGALEAIALHVPGHTPACLAYVIGDTVFPGDTLFMPDYGTARCDFPGGSAATLYRSIRRLHGLPAETRVFLCHDYKAPGRDSYAWETTIGAERDRNVHLRHDTTEAEFVRLRETRDATLPVPKLLLPSVQVNMRAGRWPDAADNGTHYLRIPIDRM